MDMLKVSGITKKYPKFLLNNVSFSLKEGYIMGFIGNNGSGKTTTLKSIMGLVNIDAGQVSIFGNDFKTADVSIKQDIGVLLGETDFYIKKKISVVTDVIKRFYSNWDEQQYRKLLDRFNLDEDKKLFELSKGMRIKYGITLALSHQAKLYILDEPTSGLDPVARDEVLELFQELVEDGTRSILYSTHITSDLEKCADYITYIKDGQIIESTSFEELIDKYKLVKGTKEELEKIKDKLISYKTNSFGFTGLIKTQHVTKQMAEDISAPTLEEIMIYYAKEKKANE